MSTLMSPLSPPRPAVDADATSTARGWALLPLFDAAAVAVTGLLTMALLRALGLPGLPDTALRLVWIAAALAPFLLDDRGADRRDPIRGSVRVGARLLRRSTLLVLVMAVLLYAGGWWAETSGRWLLLWATTGLVSALALRLLLLRAAPAAGMLELHRLQARALWVADSIPATLLADRPIRRWSAVFKAIKDLGIAAVLLLLLLPLLAVVALAIRLDSPGPLLFRQRRHGLHNAEFDIFKFRTMQAMPMSATSPLQQTLRGDVRVTRVGGFLRRWSLDELPQLFNVLNGSMSLVGPRPHAVDMRTEAQLGEEITATYPHRHRVRPGMTGWSQVNGARGATDTVEQLRRRVDLDLHYIDNWSLLLDMKILGLTSRAVLKATNAF